MMAEFICSPLQVSPSTSICTCIWGSVFPLICIQTLAGPMTGTAFRGGLWGRQSKATKNPCNTPSNAPSLPSAKSNSRYINTPAHGCPLHPAQRCGPRRGAWLENMPEHGACREERAPPLPLPLRCRTKSRRRSVYVPLLHLSHGGNF